MDKLKKVINIILDILIVFSAVMLFFSIFLDFQTSFLHKKSNDLFGFSAYEIKTASMKGSIDIGDLVLVKSTNNIDIGDIVTYKVGEEFVTHRVIQQYTDTYITRGDANNADDSPISSDQIVGKVICILPKLGLLKSIVFKSGFLVPFIIILFVICLIIDDKDDKENSYLNIIKNRFKSKKVVPNSNISKDFNGEEKISDVDLSKTAVLSKIDIKGNDALFSAIKNENQGVDDNNNDDDYDEPKIIKIL